jgi:hypothetical protein
MDERTKYVREYDGERRKRANRLFWWSLGIPPGDDDMNVQANRFGITWKELAVIGLIGLVAWVMYLRMGPTDAAYDVQFYDANGNEVRLDRWPGQE